MERVVGYFEGWAKNRPCEVFWPEQIPTGLYTHINFAFGRIHPDTFILEPNAPEDTKMYERLALLKKRCDDRHRRVVEHQPVGVGHRIE